MATRKPSLTVLASPQAEDDLLDIWGFNVKRYGLDHADSYEGILKSGINRLSTTYDDGQSVASDPDLRFVTLKRSRRGDGHRIIYRTDEVLGIAKILRIFHTKMDFETRLLESDLD